MSARTSPPFIYTVDAENGLSKICVSDELVALAEERLNFWAQLKEMAGIDVSDNMRDSVAEGLTKQLEAKLEHSRPSMRQKSPS